MSDYEYGELTGSSEFDNEAEFSEVATSESLFRNTSSLGSSQIVYDELTH